jgi:hypothetical protein
MKLLYVVSGTDATPDGYRDNLLYRGRSWWQAFKAVRAALREDMDVTVEIRRVQETSPTSMG